MFNVEVDPGGNIGVLHSLDGGQSGECHEEQRVSKMTKHVFLPVETSRGVVGLRLGEIVGEIVGEFG